MTQSILASLNHNNLRHSEINWCSDLTRNISDTASSRNRLSTTLQPQSTSSTPPIKTKQLTIFFFFCPKWKFIQNASFFRYIHSELLHIRWRHAVHMFQASIANKTICLPRFLFIAPFVNWITYQPYIPNCPSNIKFAWNVTWTTEWTLPNFLLQLRYLLKCDDDFKQDDDFPYYMYAATFV